MSIQTTACLPKHAISVRQPWAELLLRRRKTVEYRLWRLPEKYWGEWLYLHASLTMSQNEKAAALHGVGANILLRGGYVGKIRFGRPSFDFTPIEARAYTPLPYCWHWPVIDAERISFIPAKGKTRIFKVK